jgi:hypothetical protein
VFDSRADYERVVKLLLLRYAEATAPEVGDVREVDVSWTVAELDRADRWRLEVTVRPGGWGFPPGGWPAGRPPTDRPAPPARLELRLTPDDGWAPGGLADAPHEGP